MVADIRRRHSIGSCTTTTLHSPIQPTSRRRGGPLESSPDPLHLYLGIHSCTPPRCDHYQEQRFGRSQPWEALGVEHAPRCSVKGPEPGVRTRASLQHTGARRAGTSREVKWSSPQTSDRPAEATNEVVIDDVRGHQQHGGRSAGHMEANGRWSQWCPTRSSLDLHSIFTQSSLVGEGHSVPVMCH